MKRTFTGMIVASCEFRVDIETSDAYNAPIDLDSREFRQRIVAALKEKTSIQVPCILFNMPSSVEDLADIPPCSKVTTEDEFVKITRLHPCYESSLGSPRVPIACTKEHIEKTFSQAKEESERQPGGKPFSGMGSGEPEEVES